MHRARAVAAVDALTLAAATVVVLLGARASWFLVLAGGAGAAIVAAAGPARRRTAGSGGRRGARGWPGGAGVAAWALWTVATGGPLAVAGALVVAGRSSPGAGAGTGAGVALGVLATVAAVAAPAGLARAAYRRRRPPSPPREATAPRPGRGAAVAAVAAATALAVVPGATDLRVERRLVARARACPEMAASAAGVDRLTLRALAAGCAAWSGAPGFEQAVGGVRVSAHGPTARVAGEDAASAAAHYRSLLGPPSVGAVAVLPVPLTGTVRGMAGSGYVLIDEAELADPRRCGAFRRSAGVAGTCGRWVVAHEVAHQWFRWSAFARAGPAYGALWEGTADYLAYSWWRQVAGDDDAADLAGQLFGGRLDLAPAFAATHTPVAVPSGMTDGEGRALVYGRSSAAWLAVERAAGRAAAEEVLAAVYTAGLRSTATGRALAAEALEAAAAVDAGAAEVLRRWWTATPLRPAAAEWSPATAG